MGEEERERKMERRWRVGKRRTEGDIERGEMEKDNTEMEDGQMGEINRQRGWKGGQRGMERRIGRGDMERDGEKDNQRG